MRGERFLLKNKNALQKIGEESKAVETIEFYIEILRYLMASVYVLKCYINLFQSSVAFICGN